MRKKIWWFTKLLGYGWAIGLLTLMAYTWILAAISPNQILSIAVDNYNEMAFEWFFVPITWGVVVVVCLVAIIDTLQKRW